MRARPLAWTRIADALTGEAPAKCFGTREFAHADFHPCQRHLLANIRRRRSVAGGSATSSGATGTSGSGGPEIKLERLRRDREVLALAAEVRVQLLDMERRGRHREPRLPGQPAGVPRPHRAPRGGQQEAAAPQRCRGHLRRRRWNKGGAAAAGEAESAGLRPACSGPQDL
ncbi:hypothetical protein PVAP13_4KG192400 [Panicum virgatum]|uniref:Uncharacterized protein n=1 Tax=Panicum virgatum TaxID=38727 RepID=A0A8T0TP06_PANVG|nr:hypothetical protein PVAP13_4KG192400 [Panicum virgatum]